MLYVREKRMREIVTSKRLALFFFAIFCVYILLTLGFIPVHFAKNSTMSSKSSGAEVSSYSNHVFLSTLVPSLVEKRLIFIGDVHGGLEELNNLLEKLEYDRQRDHLIFVGDLTAKGPHSLEVVRRVRELGASGVRGNHDDKIIRWKGYLQSLKLQGSEYSSANIPGEFKIGSQHEYLAQNLDEDLYEYLLTLPIILEIPEYNLYVVHGGLLPNKTIHEQSPFDIMNMRNVLDNGTPTKKKHKGRPWTELWNEAQVKSSNPKTIIYGHDASRGLVIKPFSIGLDSGCGSGRQLTAMIWNQERQLIY
ncbi:hypothetical protein G9A89_014830 [Geosiphon pyriformis]|nr:hypothetical protein G9A89_014830 [Geosiphon pyriformis]